MHRLSSGLVVVFLALACGGGEQETVEETDLPEIYAAVARELAELGQVDGVVYFGDRVAAIPEAEPSQAPVLVAVGTPLSEAIKSHIVSVVTDYAVEFGRDWRPIARAQCQAGRPWGEFVYYWLGPVRTVGAASVEVLVELQDVNSPIGEKMTLVRSSDGWQATQRVSTGIFSPADFCL